MRESIGSISRNTLPDCESHTSFPTCTRLSRLVRSQSDKTEKPSQQRAEVAPNHTPLKFLILVPYWSNSIMEHAVFSPLRHWLLVIRTICELKSTAQILRHAGNRNDRTSFGLDAGTSQTKPY